MITVQTLTRNQVSGLIPLLPKTASRVRLRAAQVDEKTQSENGLSVSVNVKMTESKLPIWWEKPCNWVLTLDYSDVDSKEVLDKLFQDGNAHLESAFWTISQFCFIELTPTQVTILCPDFCHIPADLNKVVAYCQENLIHFVCK
jgi:hypothetical protein